MIAKRKKKTLRNDKVSNLYSFIIIKSDVPEPAVPSVSLTCNRLLHWHSEVIKDSELTYNY